MRRLSAFALVVTLVAALAAFAPTVAGGADDGAARQGSSHRLTVPFPALESVVARAAPAEASLRDATSKRHTPLVLLAILGAGGAALAAAARLCYGDEPGRASGPDAAHHLGRSPPRSLRLI
jgi:hypothetical protein